MRWATGLVLPFSLFLRQGKFLVGCLFVYEGFEVGEPRTDGPALVVRALKHIGSLQAVSGDARNGQIIGLDASVRVETGGYRGGDAAGRLGKDALGFSKFLDGRYDFYVRHILGPAARVADGARCVDSIGRVADCQRTRDGMRAL